jgi:hypothetical protein
MTNEWQIIWESDFKIVDKKELELMKKVWELQIDKKLLDDELKNTGTEWNEIEPGNLKDDLVKLWFLDYENMNDEEKKIFDDMKNEKRNKWYYEL